MLWRLPVDDAYTRIFWLNFTHPRGDLRRPLHAGGRAVWERRDPNHSRYRRHHAPPPTHRISPVVKDASSDARNVTAAATSSGRPGRASGMGERCGSFHSGTRPALDSTGAPVRLISTSPASRSLVCGTTALTRIP